MTSAAPPDAAQIDAFIARWQAAGGSERANYQLFVGELCALLGCPTPDPASDDTRDNAYVFERRVRFTHGDGSQSAGFIDCYRRGAFVLEAKKLRAPGHTKGFDDAMLRARAQAEGYARALPAAEGRPPFLLVVDVGHVIELYAEFSRSGATYTPFPDPRSHRIRLADLHNAALRERLRALWLEPLSLDPARASAEVTREVAAELATLAASLEAGGHAPQAVAAFLTRCLFSMFAEDVELLPERAFKNLLEQHRDAPATLHNMLRALWADMDRGGFSAALARDVLRFNGKLFKGAAADGYVLPLTRDQIDGLLRAAKANWREVEPAIFGTLLERALAPEERHALGAHYTPRAYVERLVLPTVVQPLRADWADAQAAALLLANDGKLDEARAEVRRFHHKLCTTRVLDPACGSGNFLYVTLEHLKRLEGEVFNQLDALGDTQGKLGLLGETVTLQQLLGIEINPRAAALAELVLWIGFLQWHIRTLGNASVAEPVIHDYGNIECRDAVLAYDRIDYVLDADGRAVTRWDGTHTKPHPVTGEQVPDESFQVPLEKVVNPRKAQWPAADFIVGNPPFIGNKRMREALGDGYVESLRGAWQTVPDTADFVMYWWDHAAQMTRADKLRRFGLITTNSLRQTFNRKTVERHLSAVPPLHIAYAIPDHPWVDSADGADVRISMTVGAASTVAGLLQTVVAEAPGADGEVIATLAEHRGEVHADLTVGAKVGSAQRLASNGGLCFQGMNLVGKGFRLDEAEVRSLGYDPHALPTVIQPYCNARAMMQGAENSFIVDLFGLTAERARTEHPSLYQRLFDRVKPERDHNNRESYREKWWLFGEPRGKLRASLRGLPRIILTPETSKHRVFAFYELPFCPDHKLYAISSSDPLLLGVLSSAVHAQWALRAGGRLGVGNDPTWTNTTCFLAFPFPSEDTGLTPELAQQIRGLAERIDEHRKRQQRAHPAVTLTGTYNVLAKLGTSAQLSAQEKVVHEHGLVRVLKSLHDELDAAVLLAYGWGDLVLPRDEGELLTRLVALNAERAAEEARGLVRWLRPEFQDPARRVGTVALPTAIQGEIEIGVGDGDGEEGEDKAPPRAKPGGATPASARRPWPATLPEQMRGVAELLAAATRPVDAEAIAAAFTGRGPWKRRIPPILDALAALGRARQVNGQWAAG